MRPGEAIHGLDIRRHLWFILSSPSANGLVAAANVQTHDQDRRTCRAGTCTLVTPGEHPRIGHLSCMNYKDAYLFDDQHLNSDKERGRLEMDVPASPELLARMQSGALASRFTPDEVRAAIRQASD